MAQLKPEEFIDIAKRNGCDANATLDEILTLNPNYSCNITQIRNRIASYRTKGLLPLDSGVQISLGEVLKGTTTTYDKDGNIKRQSVRTEVPKTQQLDAFLEAVENIANRVKPAKKTKAPKIESKMKDLLTVYPIGDAHIGMLAWHRETGEDHDLEISTERLTSGIKLAVKQAMPTEEAFIVDVGDWYHADDSNNRTARGGNPLDVDGRFAKVLQAGLDIAVAMIDEALKKHKTVRWRSAIGE